MKNPDAALKFDQLRASSHPQAQFIWAIFRDLFHYCAVHLAAIADNAAPAARTDVELTEDVLKKLPKLPEGIPSALYGLYPEIVNGGLEAVGLQPPSMFPQAANPVNGGNAGSFQPGQLGTGPQQPRRDPNDWTIPPGLPPLPPGIDPKIWLLYPPNLLDLIRSAPPPQQTGH